MMIFNGKTELLTLLVLDSYLCFESFCQNSGVNNNNNPFLLSLHSSIVSCVWRFFWLMLWVGKTYIYVFKYYV